MIRCRRALGTLGFAVLLGVATAGAASGAPAGQTSCAPNDNSCISTHGGGQTHIPGTHGHGSTKYCVSGYKPGTVVTITNPRTGVTRRVTVDSNGNGCTTVPITSGCQTITATGTGASGTPTSSNGRICVTQPSSGSTLPFTGSALIVPGTATGLVLLVAGTGLVLLTKRRRSASVGRHAAPSA